MSESWSFFLVSLSAIFVVVDPIGTVPLFLTVTRNQPRTALRSIALRASVVSTLILVFFTFFGGFIFKLLHLELNAFKVAGGILLLLTALDMLRARISACRCTAEEAEEGTHKEDVAITPISLPLLAGPGSITTVVVLMSQGEGMVSALPIVVALLLTFVITYFVLRSAVHVHKALGTSGMLVLERVMGLLLAAIAVQFLATGSRGLFGF